MHGEDINKFLQTKKKLIYISVALKKEPVLLYFVRIYFMMELFITNFVRNMF